jgi:dihydroxyacetone kinase DhaKLM complex PTS-EIIA-like component DhaM
MDRKPVRLDGDHVKQLLPMLKMSGATVGGHMQDRSVYSADETSSPRVSNSALHIMATIAAREGRRVRIMDIGSTYLNAEIKR